MIWSCGCWWPVCFYNLRIDSSTKEVSKAKRLGEMIPAEFIQPFLKGSPCRYLIYINCFLLIVCLCNILRFSVTGYQKSTIFPFSWLKGAEHHGTSTGGISANFQEELPDNTAQLQSNSEVQAGSINVYWGLATGYPLCAGSSGQRRQGPA